MSNHSNTNNKSEPSTTQYSTTQQFTQKQYSNHLSYMRIYWIYNKLRNCNKPTKHTKITHYTLNTHSQTCLARKTLWHYYFSISLFSISLFSISLFSILYSIFLNLSISLFLYSLFLNYKLCVHVFFSNILK